MTGRILAAVAAGLALVIVWTARSSEKTHKITSISPRKMADALHSVIAADRQTYAKLIVQRLHSDEQRLPEIGRASCRERV